MQSFPLLTCSWPVRSHSLYLLQNLFSSVEEKCSELVCGASSWQLCDGIIVCLVIFVMFFVKSLDPITPFCCSFFPASCWLLNSNKFSAFVVPNAVFFSITVKRTFLCLLSLNPEAIALSLPEILFHSSWTQLLMVCSIFWFWYWQTLSFCKCESGFAAVLLMFLSACS